MGYTLVSNQTGGNNILVNRIAKWNGRSWSALGAGVNDSVYAVAVNGSDVYVGGSFTIINNGLIVNRIAKWDGSSWSELGAGVNSTVNAIAVNGSSIYVGGSFTAINNGLTVNRIAKWNGSSWSALSSGVNAIVHAISVKGNSIYVGGDFSVVGGTTIRGIARWFDPNIVTTVSAASFSGAAVASESITAAFGSQLATITRIADTTPLPTSLGGTTVKIKDSAGAERLAPLFFVAPTQVNYLVPAGTAVGDASVTITSGDGAVSAGTVRIGSVAPGLFSANASGQGVVAGVVLRIKADGSQVYEPINRFDPTQNRVVALPIDFGDATDQIILVPFGTGWRNRSSLSGVGVKIGGMAIPVLYAGLQPTLVGLDQINLLLPRSLVGRGDVDVVLTVDGFASNTVRVSIK